MFYLFLTSSQAFCTKWSRVKRESCSLSCYLTFQGHLYVTSWGRTTEWLRLGGSWGGLVQPSAQAVTPKAICSAPFGLWIFPGMVIPCPHWGFPVFRWSSEYFSLCPLPLTPSLDTSEKPLSPSLLPLVKYLLHIGMGLQPEPSSSWTISALTFSPHRVVINE